MRSVYLDHAATTPVDPRVLKKMLPYFSENFGNPDSLHACGRRAVAAVDDARDVVAALLGASASEIYFTSGGTEADNWAVRGAAHAAYGKHIVVGATEHHAVLGAAEMLAGEGYAVSYAPVDAQGKADLPALSSLVRGDTALVAFMAANNEVGTVQPVAQMAAIAHERGALFFTDAVQAAGCMELNVRKLGADLLSLSAHKFYGPKGVGALYIRGGTPMAKLISGGQQERGMRGGTVNVPGVVGMAEAFRLACAEREERNAHISRVRDLFVEGILREVPGSVLGGHPEDRLPGNAHFTFEGAPAEALLPLLDLAGVQASAGAACSSGSHEPSHVLLAMGRPRSLSRGVRFTFGKDSSEEDALFAVSAVRDCVARLRAK